MKRRATVIISKDTAEQRESIAQRLADRKKRSAKAKMGVTMVETSKGFDSMIASNLPKNMMTGGRNSVMLPPGGSFAPGSFDNSLSAKKYKQKDDYLKNKINQSTRGFGGLGL